MFKSSVSICQDRKWLEHKASIQNHVEKLKLTGT